MRDDLILRERPNKINTKKNKQNKIMSNIPHTEMWKDFLECLRNLPALWKVKDDIFKDKELKKKSWETLLEMYKIIDPNATVDDVKKRLLGIKGCYRRELKKVQTSEKSGCGSEEVHVPSLWYFDSLDFLKDHEKQTSGLSTIEIREEQNEDTEAFNSSSRKKIKSAAHHMQERNELQRAAIENMTQPNKEDAPHDEADVYGKSWAVSFRKLSNMQQIFAKKAIDNILILGQLNQLTLNTVSTSTSSSRTSTPLFGVSPQSDVRYFQDLRTQNVQRQQEPIVITVRSEDVSNSYDSFQELLQDKQFSL